MVEWVIAEEDEGLNDEDGHLMIENSCVHFDLCRRVPKSALGVDFSPLSSCPDIPLHSDHPILPTAKLDE